MNERIKELADQAIVHANQTWDPTADPAMFVAIAMEKHAELIVRKAMDYASQNWENGHLLAEDLKVYFGVE